MLIRGSFLFVRPSPARSSRVTTGCGQLLVAFALLSLAVQVAEAEPSVWGWIVAAVPSLAFLALGKAILASAPAVVRLLSRTNRRRTGPTRSPSRSSPSPNRSDQLNRPCRPVGPPGPLGGAASVSASSSPTGPRSSDHPAAGPTTCATGAASLWLNAGVPPTEVVRRLLSRPVHLGQSRGFLRLGPGRGGGSAVPSCCGGRARGVSASPTVGFVVGLADDRRGVDRGERPDLASHRVGPDNAVARKMMDTIDRPGQRVRLGR